MPFQFDDPALGVIEAITQKDVQANDEYQENTDPTWCFANPRGESLNHLIKIEKTID